MPFIQAEDLSDYLGLVIANENVDRLTAITSAASDVLCARIGRDWTRAPRVDVVRGNGIKTLVLKHYPVTTLTSCVIVTGSVASGASPLVLDVGDPTIVDLVDPVHGILQRTDGDVWTKAQYRNITIGYVGGPDAIPAYVTLGALELAAWIYQTSGGRTSVHSGDTSVAFANLAGQAARDGFKGLVAVQEAIILAQDVLA